MCGILGILGQSDEANCNDRKNADSRTNHKKFV